MLSIFEILMIWTIVILVTLVECIVIPFSCLIYKNIIDCMFLKKYLIK